MEEEYLMKKFLQEIKLEQIVWAHYKIWYKMKGVVI